MQLHSLEILEPRQLLAQEGVVEGSSLGKVFYYEAFLLWDAAVGTVFHPYIIFSVASSVGVGTIASLLGGILDAKSSRNFESPAATTMIIYADQLVKMSSLIISGAAGLEIYWKSIEMNDSVRIALFHSLISSGIIAPLLTKIHQEAFLRGDILASVIVSSMTIMLDL
jgi:hypothetical protein